MFLTPCPNVLQKIGVVRWWLRLGLGPGEPPSTWDGVFVLNKERLVHFSSIGELDARAAAIIRTHRNQPTMI